VGGKGEGGTGGEGGPIWRSYPDPQWEERGAARRGRDPKGSRGPARGGGAGRGNGINFQAFASARRAFVRLVASEREGGGKGGGCPETGAKSGPWGRAELSRGAADMGEGRKIKKKGPGGSTRDKTCPPNIRKQTPCGPRKFFGKKKKNPFRGLVGVCLDLPAAGGKKKKKTTGSSFWERRTFACGRGGIDSAGGEKPNQAVGRGGDAPRG